MIVIVPLQGSQRSWLEPWTVLGKSSCCTALFVSGAADRENLRCGWYYKIQTQKKRDLVHEEVTNSKLIVQETTYGASYAVANTINCRMGWHLKKNNMVWLLLFLTGELLQSSTRSQLGLITVWIRTHSAVQSSQTQTPCAADLCQTPWLGVAAGFPVVESKKGFPVWNCYVFTGRYSDLSTSHHSHLP